TAEEELERSVKQLRLITERLPAFVSYMDIHRRYQFVNRAYSDWFGLPFEQVRGKTREELVGGGEVYDQMRPYEERAFAGEEVSYELTLRKANGDYRYL